MVAENINKEKPNWLLYFLVAVSIVIHAAFFLEASGRFRFKKISYIEIGVRKEVKPQTRQIPRPRIRQAAADALKKNQSPVLPDYTVPVIESVPAAVENLNPDEFVPESESPSEDIPEDVKMDVVEFSLPEVEETGGFGSRMDYLDMVRLKIESRKQYPPFSRQRNIEGMVTVEFMIGPTGYIFGLTVVRSSGFPSLDEAAIAAVNNAAPFSSPPEKYFARQVRVKVPIAFELIK
ncbi:MAG: TonB family protein [Desulfobacteraceae bacterium]|nr:TonB family protein [Desulfobacteraceae bacterium]MBC2757766.1 TonB family protein [Desulfobacteraceae bacterium]MBC2763874.1 TonB family protein [ANME-2 cluster archaeon]